MTCTLGEVKNRADTGELKMSYQGQERRRETAPDGVTAQFSGDAGAETVPAWEEIDTGRYMPRRTRGSFKGRALG